MSASAMPETSTVSLSPKVKTTAPAVFRWVLPVAYLIPLFVVVCAFAFGPSPQVQIARVARGQADIASLNLQDMSIIHALKPWLMNARLSHRVELIRAAGLSKDLSMVPILFNIFNNVREPLEHRKAAYQAIRVLEPDSLLDKPSLN